MEPVRVVIDTNLLVSYLLTAGETISRIIAAWESGQIIPVVSPPILVELTDVLERPRLRQHMVRAPHILIDLLTQEALLTSGEFQVTGISRDPKDDKFLACAIEGRAAYIVTGDADLLVLGAYEGISIVRPFELLELIVQH